MTLLFIFPYYDNQDFKVNDFVKILAIGKIPFGHEYGFKQNWEYRIIEVGYEFGDYYIVILNHTNNESIHIYEDNLKWIMKVNGNKKSNSNRIKYVSQQEVRELISEMESLNKERELDRALKDNNKQLFDKLVGDSNEKEV